MALNLLRLFPCSFILYHASCAVKAASYFCLHSCTHGSSYLGCQNVQCYQQTIVLLHSCTHGSSYLGCQNVRCYQQTIVLHSTVYWKLIFGTGFKVWSAVYVGKNRHSSAMSCRVEDSNLLGCDSVSLNAKFLTFQSKTRPWRRRHYIPLKCW